MPPRINGGHGYARLRRRSSSAASTMKTLPTSFVLVPDVARHPQPLSPEFALFDVPASLRYALRRSRSRVLHRPPVSSAPNRASPRSSEKAPKCPMMRSRVVYRSVE